MTNEHYIGLLISLLGVAASLAGIFFWRMFTRMENKIDKWADRCEDCKEGLVTSKEFGEWKLGRDGPDGLWNRVNHHEHDTQGRVVIK
ncbi:MAG: hypothetical protein ACYDHF_06160 [Candidatus Cryosericum sp.]